IFAHEFGLSRTLDIYNAAFVIPDMMLGVLVGTALSAAFVPIFTKLYDEKKELGYKYAHQIISWGVGVILVVGLIVGIFLPHFAHLLVPGFEGEDLQKYILLTRVMLISPILFTLSNAYGRILISVREFFWWGLSPALYNIGIIFGVLFLVPKFGIVGLVMGTLAGVLLHLFNRLRPLLTKKYHFKNDLDFSYSPEIKETIKLMLPKMLQYGMWFVMLLAFTSIASELPEGSVAAYNYARNFQSLPVSLLGIAIAMAMYPTLSHDAGKGNYEKFRRDFSRNRTKSLVYTTLAAIALVLLSKFVIGLLLGGGEFGQSDIDLLAGVLIVYCFAIPLESMMHAYHRAFYSLKNTIIPAFLHTAIIIITIFTAKTLAPIIGVYAIPASFGGWLFVQILVLAVVYPVLLKKRELEL
ncbi:oligosaccharide flippase family protein, partial [Patescibacteria group bacterium]|nr:oligosaccharide flippase family protein [Patescibacteria group bacterium]